MATYNYNWQKSPLLAPTPVKPKKDMLARPPHLKPLGPDSGRKPAPRLNQQERNQQPNRFKNVRRNKPGVKKPQINRGSNRPNPQQIADIANKKAQNRGYPQGQPAGNPSNGNPPPGLDQWLGSDTTYNDQMSLFQKIFEDYQLSTERQKGDVEEDYGTALERLGLERQRSMRDMSGDYASRGLLHSGLYGRDVSEYNTDYQNVVNDLSVDKNRAFEDLLESLGMFGSQMDAQKMSARQEAIRRYMERFSSLPDGQPAPNNNTSPVAPEPAPSNSGGGKKQQQQPKKPDPTKKFTGNLIDYPRIKKLAIEKDLGAKQIKNRLGDLTQAQRRAMRRAIKKNQRLDGRN